MSRRVGSLCTGYGGLEQGLSELFDVDLAWVSDIDKGASKILAHRYPDTPNLGDLTTVDWSQVEPVDVFTAGFPCQDVSHAGKRAGLRKGTRTGLWFDVLRAIACLRPSLVVLENVLGLMTGGMDDDPIDRCVCGWPHRWRGVGGSQPSQEHLHGTGGRGDDREGDRDSSDAGEFVWGDGSAGAAGDGPLGCSLYMDGDWPSGSGVSAEDRTAAPLEGGAGASGIEGRGDPRRAASVGGRPTLLLDRRGAGPMRSVEASDSRAESEGSADPAGLTGSDDCPACGGRVSDKSRRSVWRSGLGDVQRSLAQVGYVGCWRTLRASDVGAPHRRERVFIVAEPADQRHEWGRGARHGWAGPADGRLLPTPLGSDADHAGPNQRDSSGRLGLTATVVLLPTPSVSDGTGGHLSRSGDRSHELLLPGVAKSLALLPTPTAMDSKASGGSGPSDITLTDAMVRGKLLPTPTKADGDGGRTVKTEYGNLRHEVTSAWGDYAPAIARWEQTIGRPAPPPTETGPKGTPRLSPRFVEWMMGLPAGWVTDVPDLTRNEQLKALGNGVVPQQAASAVGWLLDQITRQEIPA